MTDRRDHREWVSFTADDGDTWLFDLSFFASPWHCIYGSGCAGIESEPAPEQHRGCCSYGAHFADDADLERVMSVARALPGRFWDNRALVPELDDSDITDTQVIDALTTVDDDGDRVTRVVEGACIFLNAPGSDNGPGCAIHVAALHAEIEPLEWKPEVCWQLPIRVEHHVDDNDQHTHFVRQWTRADWGPHGDLGWWCSEAPEAYTSSSPVAVTLQAEVAALAGDRIAEALVDHVARRGRSIPVTLPTRSGKR